MHDMNLRSTEFSADGAIDRYQHWIKGANWKNAMTIHDQSLRSKKHHYWAVAEQIFIVQVLMHFLWLLNNILSSIFLQTLRKRL